MEAVYLEYDFKVHPKEPATEILIAQLGYAGFESFVENEKGVLAYIQKEDWNANMMKEVSILDSEEFEISYQQKEIEQVNWNSEWEKNFNPIEVDGVVSVRAPFHKSPNLKYDIVIEPKMSFGTGHHETTYMMIQHLNAMELSDRKVLDMGCGTGILAIFAEKKGARPIDAIDIDYWCYENSIENCQRNNCQSIEVFQGDAKLLKNKTYDVVIANINRNILLKDMSIYASCLQRDGVLLLSGFYSEDVAVLSKTLEEHNLRIESQLDRHNWVALKCLKS